MAWVLRTCASTDPLALDDKDNDDKSDEEGDEEGDEYSDGKGDE